MKQAQCVLRLLFYSQSTIMNISLVFDKTGDTLTFEVIYNHELIEFFVDRINKKSQNSFSDDHELYKNVDKKLTHLHWAISKTNEVLYELIGKSFKQKTNLEDYLYQPFLNELHSDWVFSHYNNINIDDLRFSDNLIKAKIGSRLHEMYPDEIRDVPLAPLLEKIGYLYPFREVNMGVHRLESSYRDIEFKSDAKWEVFENPYLDQMVSNNDIVNFSFAYTYVGRQYYNKFRFFDSNLECPDHYNFETLEVAFQVNLRRPETIPFSHEATEWANKQKVKLVAEQIPIANLIDLEEKLFDYRKVLYRNSRDNNRASIILN